MLATASRYLCAFVVSSLVLNFSVEAQETQQTWKVDKASGEAWVVSSGAQNAALTNDTEFKAGDSVRTGKSGRVLLRRGQETILISPNSVIGLPAETKPGSTTIIQQAGSILLEVNKRAARTFEVETPYLVAAVKGTQFNVVVGAKGADVSVKHGSVEVADVKSGKFALVMPGQSAKVSSIGSGGLSLRGMGTLSPIQNGAPRPSTVGRVPVPRGGLIAPAALRASLQTAPMSATAQNKGMRIAAPIGQVRLDVNTATRGLAREATTVRGRSSGTIWNSGNGQGAAAAASTPGLNTSAANGMSVAPALNNSRPLGPAGVPTETPNHGPGGGQGPSKHGRGNGYAYGNTIAGSGLVPGIVVEIGSGNGRGNNGNGNGNGGGNGNNGGGNGRGNNGNGNGNGGGNGNNGGGNAQGNNGNGNGGGRGP